MFCLKLDIENFELNLYRGIDILKVLAVDCPYMSKLCACFNNSYTLQVGELSFCGSTFGTSNEKSWQSFTTDLGYRAKRKKIKEIVLNTKFACDVEISSDEETKTFAFAGSEKEQRLPVSVYGKNFSFCFKTNAEQCEISKPMIVFDVVA